MGRRFNLARVFKRRVFYVVIGDSEDSLPAIGHGCPVYSCAELSVDEIVDLRSACHRHESWRTVPTYHLSGHGYIQQLQEASAPTDLQKRLFPDVLATPEVEQDQSLPVPPSPALRFRFMAVRCMTVLGNPISHFCRLSGSGVVSPRLSAVAYVTHTVRI
jgi:hypothetical protein